MDTAGQSYRATLAESADPLCGACKMSKELRNQKNEKKKAQHSAKEKKALKQAKKKGTGHLLGE